MTNPIDRLIQSSGLVARRFHEAVAERCQTCRAMRLTTDAEHSENRYAQEVQFRCRATCTLTAGDCPDGKSPEGRAAIKEGRLSARPWNDDIYVRFEDADAYVSLKWMNDKAQLEEFNQQFAAAAKRQALKKKSDEMKAEMLERMKAKDSALWLAPREVGKSTFIEEVRAMHEKQMAESFAANVRHVDDTFRPIIGVGVDGTTAIKPPSEEGPTDIDASHVSLELLFREIDFSKCERLSWDLMEHKLDVWMKGGPRFKINVEQLCDFLGELPKDDTDALIRQIKARLSRERRSAAIPIVDDSLEAW